MKLSVTSILLVPQGIVNYNRRSLVASVSIFTHADPNLVTDVVTKLQYEVSDVTKLIVTSLRAAVRGK